MKKSAVKTITPNRINLLVIIAQKYNNTLATNKLWDFYFPLVKDIILYKVAKDYPLVEEYVADIIDDAYFCFVQGLSTYDKDTYCFSSYIESHINICMDEIISKYVCETSCESTF